VRIPFELINQALETLPKDVKLYQRSSVDTPISNLRSCFMGAGTPVHVFDLKTEQRRDATLDDVRQLVYLQDRLEQVDIVRPTVTATDVGENSDLAEIFELLRYTTKPIVHRTLAPERVDAAVEMLSAVAGGEDSLRKYPNFATVYCPISPGYFTPENVRCMLRWAEHEVPITILTMAMGGASAPVTLLGELIVINTDILAWIVALQILFPNTPLLYGSVSSVLDMRTGLLALGSPERGMVNSGAAVMGQYYGIPSMCGGLSSDAKQLDAQAGFEKAVTAVPLMSAGASIIYGVGATDAGSSISYSQMVLDNEIIAGLRRMMEGINLHNVDEEVALIKELTPRGNFLKTRHTRSQYSRHWQPEILSRDTFDTWSDKGETNAEVCKQEAQQILADCAPVSLSAEVESEIERVLRVHVGENLHIE
jgi:trimethylamine--corrinoid protein Co-methyltransferase